MENLCFARMNKNGIRIQFSQFKTAANRAVLVLVRLARQNAKSEDVTNSILLSFLKVLFLLVPLPLHRPPLLVLEGLYPLLDRNRARFSPKPCACTPRRRFAWRRRPARRSTPPWPPAGAGSSRSWFETCPAARYAQCDDASPPQEEGAVEAQTGLLHPHAVGHGLDVQRVLEGEALHVAEPALQQPSNPYAFR